MLNKFYSFFFTLSLICFLGTTTSQAQLPVSTSSENKNVVLEEFTGLNCVWCPDGHRRANNLASSNPGDVLLINVHEGGFAQPGPGQPDFRTSFGSDLVNQADVTGYPAGTINRHLFSQYSQGSGTAMGRGDWQSAASTILGQSSYANVALEGTLDVQTRELTVDAEVYFTSNGAQDNNLNVALLQDSILGPQSGAETLYPQMVNPYRDYLHMHMLRHFLTGQWGDVINNTSSGNLESRQYTYTLPNDINGVPLELGDLEIVAYLDTGEQEIITGNDGPITYTNFPTTDNVGIQDIEGLDEVCEAYGADILVKNHGSAPITSMEIEYDMNGNGSNTYNWSGNLNSLDRQWISLPMESYSPNSTNSYNVEITAVNGSSDEDPSDNSISKSNIAQTTNEGSGEKYMLTVVQDQYGSDTEWEVVDAQGSVIASGGPYSDLGSSGNEEQVDSFTVANTGCYRFRIYDSYGDGINNGSYKIETAQYNATVLSGDGDFGPSATEPFKVTSLTSIGERELGEASLELYPNPVTEKARVDIQVDEATEGRIEVRDLTGRTVKSEQVNVRPGASPITLDMSGQESGMYIFRLVTDQGSTTERFSVVDP